MCTRPMIAAAPIAQRTRVEHGGFTKEEKSQREAKRCSGDNINEGNAVTKTQT
jgi:hypothetical protein